MKAQITDRQAEIIRHVIEEYVDEGTSVSSQVLVEKYCLPYSSATIRKEMSILEQMDYLFSPHTSSGRRPTEGAFRFYIERVLSIYQVAPSEKKRLESLYEKNGTEVETVLKGTAQNLAKASACVGFVTAPLSQNSIIQNIHLVSVRSDCALIIMVSTASTIFQNQVTLLHSATQEDLNIVSRFFNKHLSALDLGSLQQRGLSFLSDTCGELGDLAELGVMLLQNFVYNPPEQKVHLDGLNNLHNKLLSEDKSTSEAEEIIEKVKNRDFLLNLAEEIKDDEEVFSCVGMVLDSVEYSGVSFLGKMYTVDGRKMGYLGVIGSVRMPYNRLIPTILCSAHLLSGVFQVQKDLSINPQESLKLLDSPSQKYNKWSIMRFERGL